MGVWIETPWAQPSLSNLQVTPFVGVWIETYLYPFGYALRMSHPSWVCGLKPQLDYAHIGIDRVTPFVGVWIETDLYIPLRERIKVTPFVGVWIETK